LTVELNHFLARESWSHACSWRNRSGLVACLQEYFLLDRFDEFALERKALTTIQISIPTH
jgi:hypothetical protein